LPLLFSFNASGISGLFDRWIPPFSGHDRDTEKRSRQTIPISLRLLLALVAAVLLIMAGYMVISHQQRRVLLMEGLVRDVELLGGVLWISADEMLEAGRVGNLDELLRMTLQAEEVFAAVVLDAAGAVMAVDAADLPCLRRHLPPFPHLTR
jgi:hypothetical protein